MIALLLAGGKGTRLRQTGRYYPKPLIPIGAEPVINHLIDKLAHLNEVERIYVLTRKKQTVESDGQRATLDLYTAFDKWKDVWYSENRERDQPGAARTPVAVEDDRPDAVSSRDIVPLYVLYEENLSSDPEVQTGAIAGLCRFEQWLNKHGIPYDAVLVVAADNFIEDDLSDLIAKARDPSFCRAAINAYFDFGDKERIRGKYGCLKTDRHGWVTDYEEKPGDPSMDQTKASTAVYLFPKQIFAELKEYSTSEDATLFPARMDAPGNFLKWLVKRRYPYDRHGAEKLRDQGIGVQGYCLKGEWFDIGSKPDLIAAIKFYIDHHLLVMNTVDDLLLADRAHTLTDKHYLLCWRLSICPEKNLICLHFQSTDKICKLHNGIPGSALTISEVKARSKQASYWSAIEAAIDRNRGGFNDFDKTLADPLLVSGGVFLFDSVGGCPAADGMKLPAQRTLVPVLEKDPGSKTDGGRLTTPAGRMDILDLRQVCYSELCEEMIFYGVPAGGHQARIFAVAPLELKDIKRRVLRHMMDNNVLIPAIDRERIEAESVLAERDITIVERVIPIDIILPSHECWEVNVYLNGHIHSHCSNVIVIPDRENSTLEFRLACYADITGSQTEAAPECNTFSKQVGRLLGIADGDGFSRRPFLLAATAFLGFHESLMSCDKNQLVEYLTRSQHNAAEVLAAGAPGNGRFESFDCQLPVLHLTTSVHHLAKVLSLLL